MTDRSIHKPKKRQIFAIFAKAMFVLVLPAFVAGACQQNENKPCRISGEFVGRHSADRIFLKKISENKLVTLDTAAIENARFQFSEFYLNSPEMVYLQPQGEKALIQLFAENSKIHLQIPADDFSKTLISGSEVHAEYAGFLNDNEVYNQKLKDIYLRILDARRREDRKIQHELDSLKKLLLKEQQAFIYRYVLENSNSHTALYVTAENLSQYSDYAVLNKILNNFSLELSVSSYYKKIEHKLEQKASLAAGKKAPELNFLKDTDTHEATLCLIFPFPDSFYLKQAKELFQRRKGVISDSSLYTAIVLPREAQKLQFDFDKQAVDVIYTEDEYYRNLSKLYDLKYACKSFIIDRDSVILKYGKNINTLENYLIQYSDMKTH